MDDLSEKLAGLLNDPESMNRVRQMAESLLGEKSGQGSLVPEQQKSEQSLSLPDSNELQSIMGVISRLKSGGEDSRAQLLKALKPHLSEPRREKVDTAIKILKLIELLPFLKESGILDF